MSLTMHKGESGPWARWCGGDWKLSLFPSGLAILTAAYDEGAELKISSRQQAIYTFWQRATGWELGPSPRELDHALAECQRALDESEEMPAPC